jgi:chorismate mutase
MRTLADLAAIRREIDMVDDQIAALLVARIRLVYQTAPYKEPGHVRDRDREREIIQRIRAFVMAAGGDADCAARVFDEILQVSREALGAALNRMSLFTTLDALTEIG